MNFWSMLDAMEPAEQERILREQAARFACEAPKNDEAGEPPSAGQPIPDEREP